MNPAMRAIGSHDAIDLVILAGNLFRESRFQYAFAIIGMDGFNPTHGRGVKAFAGPSPDFLISGADVNHLVLRGIGDPENLPDVLCQLPETFLTRSQELLGLLAFGDVAHESEYVAPPQFEKRRDDFHLDDPSIFATVASLETVTPGLGDALHVLDSPAREKAR